MAGIERKNVNAQQIVLCGMKIGVLDLEDHVAHLEDETNVTQRAIQKNKRELPPGAYGGVSIVGTLYKELVNDLRQEGYRISISTPEPEPASYGV